MIRIRFFWAQGIKSENFFGRTVSGNPSGERLYPSMTEEGPTGVYKMTMQRDRHGRWMPTKGVRTMNIQKAREERRNFYVVGRSKHSAWRIYFNRRNADEVSWRHLSAEEQTEFTKTFETEWQEVLDFGTVTIIDSTQADVIREKHSERVISSRLVLRWKETDSGYKAKARWCVHGFKDPDIHEIERETRQEKKREDKRRKDKTRQDKRRSKEEKREDKKRE